MLALWGVLLVLGPTLATADLVVGSVFPPVADVSGGTTLTVSGSGFVSGGNPVCKFTLGVGHFGVVFTPAAVVNATTLTCPSPAVPVESTSDVDVSMNGGSNATDDHVHVSLVKMLQVGAASSLFTCGGSPQDDPTVDVLVQVLPYVGDVTIPAVPHLASGLAGAGSPSSRRHDQVAAPSLTATVTLDLGNRRLATASIPADGYRHAISVPLSDFTGGACPVTTTVRVTAVSQGMGTLADNATVKVAPWKPNQVTVNYRTNSLSVGKGSFLLYGWLMNSGVYPDTNDDDAELARLANQGFTTIMPYVCWTPPESCNNSMPQLLAFMDVAWRHGLRVEANILAYVGAYRSNPTPEGLAAIQAAVQQIMDHPALLGYYVSDDTFPLNATSLAAVYAALKAVDPYHVVFNTQNTPDSSWVYTQPGALCADVTQYEVYDLDNVFGVLYDLPTYWPVTWVVQSLCGQGYTLDTTPLGAPRIQGYLAFLSGSAGIVLFDYWTWTNSASQVVTTAHTMVTTEMMEVAAGMFSGVTVPPTIAIHNFNTSSVPGPVIGRAWQANDGTVYVAIANVGLSPAMFTLDCSFLPITSNNTLTVLYAGTTAVLTDNNGTSLTSYIDGLATRVFTWMPPPALPVSSALRAHAASPPVTNAVLNPSFEMVTASKWVSSWTKLLDQMAFASNSLMSVDTTQPAVSGTHTLRLVAPGAQTDVVGVEQYTFLQFPIGSLDAPLTTTNWTYSIHVRPSVPPKDGHFSVGLCTAEIDPFRPVTTPTFLCPAVSFTAADAYQWHLLSCPLAITKGLGVCWSGPGGVLWLDDASLSPPPSP